MRNTRHTLDRDLRARMADLLNARLADAIDLQLRAKHAHWNVRGEAFLTVHELFDKVADAADSFADDIAERALALGASAQGNVADVARASSLGPVQATPAHSQAEHLRAVATALAIFASSTRAAIDQASSAGDQATADLFTGVTREADKLLWFVESHLGERG